MKSPALHCHGTVAAAALSGRLAHCAMRTFDVPQASYRRYDLRHRTYRCVCPKKEEPTDQAPKPTLADAQKVVEMISNDMGKLQTYCEIGKLEDETAQAEETKDTKAVEALISKAEALAQQMGPEYIKLVEGLELIDPKSVEAEKFVAILSALDDKCN
jgi:hypothetical protein